eukprot:Skav221948  [mRNA]  locus=scaffold195:516967:517682:- [translate_table: standard]
MERTAWGAFDLVLGADLLLDSRHCDAFRAVLRPLLHVSPEILLMERNRSGTGSRCATEIVADGFWAQEAPYQKGLSHVVVDGLSDPPWLHEEASEAMVLRVRRKGTASKCWSNMSRRVESGCLSEVFVSSVTSNSHFQRL